jgi:16S rRNA G527 N7-methylase RsmG
VPPADNAAQPELAATAETYRRLVPRLSPEVAEKLAGIKMHFIAGGPGVSGLTAAATENFDLYQMVDCIAACELVLSSATSEKPVFDLSYNHGLPGLIAAVLFPALSFVIPEVDPKKVEFLNLIISRLKLLNVRAQASNLDEIPAGSVKFGMIRHSGQLAKTLLGARKATAVDGTLMHLKSDKWSQELAGIPSQLFTHWEAALVGLYRIPGTETDMAVVSTRKISD